MPRPIGSKNKLNAFESLDINSMNQQEKLKFIQIGLQYVIPKLRSIKQSEPLQEPQTYQIEIIGGSGEK